MADDNVNRVGDQCWYFVEDCHGVRSDWKTGRLRMWSVGHKVHHGEMLTTWTPGMTVVGEESSLIPFPVGVIEDEISGEVLSIPVSDIRFVIAKPRW